MSREIPERLKWFLERIGQKIYRNDDGCSCEICKHIVEHGLVIQDRHQAEYCYDCETEFTSEGTPMRYFDTKAEVEEWINSLNSSILRQPNLPPQE